MSAVWTMTALLNKMDYLSAAYFANFEIGLFQSDTMPLVTSILSDFTEANFDGYMRQSFGTWTPAYTSGDASRSDAPSVNWLLTSTPSTTNQIYGFLAIDGGGNLAYAERFTDGPYPMESLGDGITVTGSITEESKYT